MKLLVVTVSAWDDSNSLGNTLTNLLADWDAGEIANLYCRAARPSNPVCRRYFSVSEFDLVRSLGSGSAGRGFTTVPSTGEGGEPASRTAAREAGLYSFFRRHPLTLLLWARELLWLTGRWRSRDLDAFLDDFSPDVILAPATGAGYVMSLLRYAQQRTNARVALYHLDDILTVAAGKSPLARVERRLGARRVARSARAAGLNYCISPLMQREYSSRLGLPMKLLFKGADFAGRPAPRARTADEPIRIVYTGSVLWGRWKTLGSMARAIRVRNAQGQRFTLSVYSQYQPSRRARKALTVAGSSSLMGAVPAAEVPRVLADADVVLHVESFGGAERRATRLSFSTKIVDCLHSGRCILAIGGAETASIDHLRGNDAALVATSEQAIGAVLDRIARNPGLLAEYADKAWECGVRNHDAAAIRRGLRNDLELLAAGGS